MSTITLRPCDTVDLGYMSLVGALEWDDIHQELSIRSTSGYADLIANAESSQQAPSISAAPGCVLLDDWGYTRKVLIALEAAGILERVQSIPHADSVYVEARVVLPQSDQTAPGDVAPLIFWPPTTPILP